MSPSRVATWVCLVWALIGLMGVPESAAAAGAGGKGGNAAAKGDVGFILLNSEDTTPPSIRVGDAHVAEGDSGVSELVFPIEVRGQLLAPITLAWATTNGTAVFPDDFAASSGSVSIAAGVRNAEIRVPIVTDMIEEVNEAFLLGIALGPESTGAARLVDRTAAGVIMNDDGLRDRVQRFEWSVPSGVKRPGEPIAVELRAIDGFGQVVSNFSGSVSLGAVRLGRPTDSGHPSPLVIAEIHHSRTDQLVEVWNTSGQDLDISGWKVWIYENFRWPLPQQSFVFPPGTVIPANTLFTLNERPWGTFREFLIRSPRWGPAWNGPVPVAELCIGVLLQKDTGEVVDFFGAGGADPRQIRVPTALEPWVWNGPTFPALGRVGPADEALVYQRVGQSNPRNAAAWHLGIGETTNRYMKLAFVDGAPQSVTPSTATGFVEGVWRGSITIADPARWMSLYVTDGSGHVGVHAPLEFEVGNDLRIESYILGSPLVGGGQMFSQQIIVTNPGPAASTDVQLRVVIPYHFEAILDVNGELRVSREPLRWSGRLALPHLSSGRGLAPWKRGNRPPWICGCWPIVRAGVFQGPPALLPRSPVRSQIHPEPTIGSNVSWRRQRPLRHHSRDALPGCEVKAMPAMPWAGFKPRTGASPSSLAWIGRHSISTAMDALTSWLRRTWCCAPGNPTR